MKVIQCWDDGIVDDIRLTETLRRYSAKAAFSLNPGLNLEERSFGWVHEGREVWRLSAGELPDLYDGFEICSHSMTHPYLTEVSAERLTWEVGSEPRHPAGYFQKACLRILLSFQCTQ